MHSLPHPLPVAPPPPHVAGAGVFLPFLWVVVIFLPCCTGRATPVGTRERRVVRMCAIGAAVGLVVYIVLAAVLGVWGVRGWGGYGGGCYENYGRSYYC